MGNNLVIDESELSTLSNKTRYSEETIRMMHKKFSKLDRTEKGYVGTEDLNFIGEYKSNDLNKIITSQLASGVGEQLDFKKLLLALSAFQYNSQDAKLRFLFDMCDKDKKGKLSVSDLVGAFKLIKVEHFNENDINEIAIQTVKFADQDGDGSLNFEEFKNFYNNVLQITI